MDDGADDLQYLIAGADDLAAYLESDVLFWPLQSQTQPLTIGNLLLAQKRVAALFPSGDPKIQQADDQIAQGREKRGAAWRRRASSEFHARLAQFKSTIMDASEADNRGVSYPVLARLRVILELLRGEIEGSLQADTSLSSLDVQLQKLITSADFIWQQQLQSAFPTQQFWFLYAKYAKRSAG